MAAKTRVDGQITSLAGEFLTAGELLTRELQTSVTFGNAKAVDLFAHNSITGRTFIVQVKALRYENYFDLGTKGIKRNCIYVFVIVGAPNTHARFFVVKGSTLLNEEDQFGAYIQDEKRPWNLLEKADSLRKQLEGF